MKSGPNFQDRNQIKKLLDAGKTAEQISAQLRIELTAVQNNVDAFLAADKPKRKRRSKEEMAEAEAEKVMPHVSSGT